jgi:caulimovirus viroplasmin
MTTIIYLDLETLTIEQKESTRDYIDLLDSAQKYYAKKGIRTMKERIGGMFFLQERECRNILMLATEDGYNKHDLKIVTDKIMSLPYYAVARGYVPGVYRTWSQTKDSVDGYNSRKYKKFSGKEAAKQFMVDNNAPLRTYDYL